MNKTNRIVLSTALLAAATLSIMAFTFAGSRTVGPLGQALDSLGSVLRRTETQMALRLRGPGRAMELQWFSSMRSHRDSLANPSEVLLGAYDSGLPFAFDGLTSLEVALETPMPIVHLFTAWGDRAEDRFPRKFAETVWDLGSVPMITWEPWLTTFDASVHRHLGPSETRDRGGMAAVARGDFDFYLHEWLEAAARFEQPVFVRFGHEMNDAYRYPWGPHNNRAEEYVAAFRYVVGKARQIGATNILWVWSPHIAYDDFDYYYPGDDVVDWIGATVLNYGNVAYWSEWWTFDDIFTRKYDRLAARQKPIMLAETGSLMAGGERAPWFEQALTRLPKRLPHVKAVVFFHNRADATITYQALNWAFDDDGEVIAAIRRSLQTWDTPSDSSAVASQYHTE
jgi:hypothetical protein